MANDPDTPVPGGGAPDSEVPTGAGELDLEADVDGDSDDGSLGYADDDYLLGSEAAVPPGEYGPPIVSVMPEDRSRKREVRELERRVQAQLNPAYPIEPRRQLPLPSLWRRYRRLAMRNRSDIVDEFGRDPIAAARVEPLLEFLFKRYFRVELSGVDNVPDEGRALLVANHGGTLPYDGAMIMHAVRRQHRMGRDVRPLVEDFVFHFPYLGTLINRIGGVRACQENATRLLEDGQLVAVFPEGLKGAGKLYRQRYQLQRFGRGGFVKLALRTSAPIIPVAVVGAEDTHPMLTKVTWLARSLGLPHVPITPTFPWLGPLGLVPLPSKWFIEFGAPIDLPARYGPEAADDRLLVNRLAESVRSQLQERVDALRSRRKSVLRG